METTFLTPDDLSKILKVSRVWIYKLCDQGRIPFLRIAGKAIRFRQGDIEKWLEDSRGIKYERDKAKLGLAVGGLPGVGASTVGSDTRAPALPSGEQR